MSVPSNIAEGCGRHTDRDTARFVSVAIGSAFETETQLVLAARFGYPRDTRLLASVVLLQRQLTSFHDRLLGRS